jgi:prevent-host-death family protein
MTVVGSVEVQQNFDELLERVDQGEEHLVVEKAGTPIAALIGMKEYEEFRSWLATRLLREMGPKLSDQAEQIGLTEENLADRLKESRSAINQRHYGANKS